jgi:3-mercaptopyruvate sulfurtransferase SseA
VARAQRVRRAFEVVRVARRGKLARVLREVGVVGERPATREGAQEFRKSLVVLYGDRNNWFAAYAPGT